MAACLPHVVVCSSWQLAYHHHIDVPKSFNHSSIRLWLLSLSRENRWRDIAEGNQTTRISRPGCCCLLPCGLPSLESRYMVVPLTATYYVVVKLEKTLWKAIQRKQVGLPACSSPRTNTYSGSAPPRARAENKQTRKLRGSSAVVSQFSRTPDGASDPV